MASASRRSFLAASSAALVAGCSCGESDEDPAATEAIGAEAGRLYSFQEPHMGTLFTLRVWVPDDGEQTVEALTAVSRAGFDRVAAINAICSDYLVESELNTLSAAPAGEPVAVSSELLDVLQRCQHLFEVSDGAFDPTVGPMVRLWRRSRRSNQLPTEVQIAGAKARTGMEKVTIDSAASTVTKSVEGMVFDLGGIAKGYAADAVLAILHEAGYQRALVAASGDIALGEPPPGEVGWAVGLDTMEMAKAGDTSFRLATAAVSTSGDTQRYLEIDGQRYSHIVDKSTGLGLTERIAVSVIAKDATTTDSYATAVSLLGLERGMKLIEATDGVECRIVTAEMEVHRSSGFPEGE